MLREAWTHRETPTKPIKINYLHERVNGLSWGCFALIGAISRTIHGQCRRVESTGGYGGEEEPKTTSRSIFM